MSEPLTAFAGLLEAEWYNGNIDESAYLRLNADLTGILAKYVALAAPPSDAAAPLREALMALAFPGPHLDPWQKGWNAALRATRRWRPSPNAIYSDAAARCPDCGAEPGKPHGQAEYGRCDGYPARSDAAAPLREAAQALLRDPAGFTTDEFFAPELVAVCRGHLDAIRDALTPTTDTPSEPAS